MARHELVFRVDKVDLSLLKSNPPQLGIHADGMARSGGYTDARLVEVIYVTPPADGIWEYTFEAVPPAGPATLPLTPVSAYTIRATIPAGFKGVRVKAATNDVVAQLEVLAPQQA